MSGATAAAARAARRGGGVPRPRHHIRPHTSTQRPSIVHAFYYHTKDFYEKGISTYQDVREILKTGVEIMM
ncbi:hypothetical protein JYU34_002529 [Plutella xylostella]|uniref:Uncharacterized protein n=1 Tax=Plutella xylostella TaxID=51655 RepID=A0ABQ7R2F4_PLUXY|nr:hypothetical protein JYU34_002529 [Plutella xylostella]